jgi:hypothetical protein
VPGHRGRVRQGPRAVRPTHRAVPGGQAPLRGMLVRSRRHAPPSGTPPGRSPTTTRHRARHRRGRGRSRSTRPRQRRSASSCSGGSASRGSTTPTCTCGAPPRRAALLGGGGDRHRRHVADLALAGHRRELHLELAGGRPTAPGPPSGVRRQPGGLDERRAARGPGRLRLPGAALAPPWGRDASPVEQLVIDEELAAAGVKRPNLFIGGWILPTIIGYGTPEQQEQFIRPTLRGELTWCQLFSEPGAGSDLAALQHPRREGRRRLVDHRARRSGPPWRTGPTGGC